MGTVLLTARSMVGKASLNALEENGLIVQNENDQIGKKRMAGTA